MKPAQEITWTEVAPPDSIIAMVRPAIAKRIEWLEYVANQPQKGRETDEAFLALFWAYRPRLWAIERELAEALTRHRWDVRGWALEHPAMRGKAWRDHGLYFHVDGVRVQFCERQTCYWVMLSGDDWRRLKAERAMRCG